MHCPKLAWNRSTAKERNINRSFLGWAISFLTFLIHMRDGTFPVNSGLPRTRHIYSGRERATEGSGLKEYLYKNSGWELKCTVCFFAFQSMIPFPVFVILKLKTFAWCARQQNQETSQVTNTLCVMPGKAIKVSVTSEKSRLGFVLDTKLIYHCYT